MNSSLTFEFRRYCLRKTPGMRRGRVLNPPPMTGYWTAALLEVYQQRRCNHPAVGAVHFTPAFLNLNELLTTVTELKAMARAASTGLRKPWSPKKNCSPTGTPPITANTG